jgi:thioester reductase-like protein
LGTVLLTGSTGFLGAHVAFRLVTETDHGIVALVRAKDKEAARLRLSRVWWDWPELIKALDSRVNIVLALVMLNTVTWCMA